MNTTESDPLARTNIDVWYAEPIEKVRVTADPGGDTLDVEQARALRDQLDTVISHAEERR